jgi:hypothetical protein
MSSSIINRSRFIGISAGVLAAMLIWPSTRWVLKSQMTTALSAADPSGIGEIDYNASSTMRAEATHAIAARHPNDVQMQIADATTVPPAVDPIKTPDSIVKVARLHALATRLPDSPSVYANAMRFATQGMVLVHRAETSEFEGEKPYSRGLQPAKADDLAAFDHDAAEGERLDPDNAYFPLMRVISQFDNHQDDEALASLKRASNLPTFREYYIDEVEGQWRIAGERFGHPGAIAHVAMDAAVLFPQYASLRSVARVAAYKAMLAEQAGDTRRGLEIRLALMRCGDKMRVQAQSAIGALVGIAITHLGISRPGGVPYLKPKDNTDVDAATQRKLDEFCAYLNRTGNGSEVAQVRAEIEACTTARKIIREGAERSSSWWTPIGLVSSWVTGYLMVVSAVWMVALGLIAKLVSRTPRIKNGAALPKWMRRSIPAGMLAAICIGIGLLAAPRGVDMTPAAVFTLLIAVFAGSGSKLTGKERAKALGVFALSGMAFFGVGYLATLQIMQCVPYANMLSAVSAENDSAIHLSAGQGALAALVLVITAAPILTAISLSVLSRTWRVPLTVGLCRGFIGCAAPIAAAIVLIGCALAPVTTSQDTQLENFMERIAAHEGPYFAELTGKSWPGPVM